MQSPPGIKGSPERSPERRPQRPVGPMWLEQNLDGDHSPGGRPKALPACWALGSGPGSPLPVGTARHPISSSCHPTALSPWSCPEILTVQIPMAASLPGCLWMVPQAPGAPLSPPHLPIPALPPPFMASEDTMCHGFRATETKAHCPKRHSEPQRPSLEVTHPD